MISRSRFRAIILISLVALCLPASQAEEANPPPDQEQWNLHFQATAIPQGHGEFTSPYSGTNSLPPREPIRTSYTATLFLGARLWAGSEVFVNPELAGGRGVGGVTGIAGFPNGDIARVSKPEPTVSMARVFLRQTVGLGGEPERVASGPNQLAGARDLSRLTVTLGKISVGDIFDGNAYSHDARTQFMNWGLFENGAWDYPADTRGYTWGGALELIEPRWALRYGLFAEPKTANGLQFDHNFSHAHGHVLEWEQQYSVGERRGVARLLGYWNRAHMGSYRATLDTPAYGLDIARSRRYSDKYGFGLNVEQELTKSLGSFARLGWSDGQNETWAFTEIDQTASFGLSLKGAAWSRPADTFGVAGVINGLSKEHKDYLAAGGYVFIIGDGRLNYAPEDIIEVYYLVNVWKGISITPDYQFVNHPAYNADRGPVHLWAVRFHAEF